MRQSLFYCRVPWLTENEWWASTGQENKGPLFQVFSSSHWHTLPGHQQGNTLLNLNCENEVCHEPLESGGTAVPASGCKSNSQSVAASARKRDHDAVAREGQDMRDRTYKHIKGWALSGIPLYFILLTEWKIDSVPLLWRLLSPG